MYRTATKQQSSVDRIFVLIYFALLSIKIYMLVVIVVTVCGCCRLHITCCSRQHSNSISLNISELRYMQRLRAAQTTSKGLLYRTLEHSKVKKNPFLKKQPFFSKKIEGKSAKVIPSFMGTRRLSLILRKLWVQVLYRTHAATRIFLLFILFLIECRIIFFSCQASDRSGMHNRSFLFLFSLFSYCIYGEPFKWLPPFFRSFLSPPLFFTAMESQSTVYIVHQTKGQELFEYHSTHGSFVTFRLNDAFIGARKTKWGELCCAEIPFLFLSSGVALFLLIYFWEVGGEGSIASKQQQQHNSVFVGNLRRSYSKI